MTLDNELSQIATVVDERERELNDGKFDANAIVSQIRNIDDPDAKIRKAGEWTALLTGKLDTLDLPRLIALKNQHPNDARIKALGRRVVNCYLAFCDINASISENLVSPDLRPTARTQNQEMRNGIEKLFGSYFQ